MIVAEVPMNIKLVSITENSEKNLEFYGRICYDSGDKTGENTSETFLFNLLKNGHLSILEHASASFFIDGVSRACTHQLVRHRLASYTQQSQRYVRADDFGYTIPHEVRDNPEALRLYRKTIAQVQESYDELIKLGIKKQDARFLLPNAAHTTIAMTANFREWLHIIDLRVSRHAQWEIREMTVLIWKELFQRAPSVFGLTYFLHWSKDFDYKKEMFEKHINS